MEMQSKGIDIIDPFILSSIIGASANLAVLGLGKQIALLYFLVMNLACLLAMH